MCSDGDSGGMSSLFFFKTFKMWRFVTLARLPPSVFTGTTNTGNWFGQDILLRGCQSG